MLKVEANKTYPPTDGWHLSIPGPAKKMQNCCCKGGIVG